MRRGKCCQFIIYVMWRRSCFGCLCMWKVYNLCRYQRRSWLEIEAVNKYRLIYVPYQLRARSSKNPNDISGGCEFNIPQFTRRSMWTRRRSVVPSRKRIILMVVVFGVIGSILQLSWFDTKIYLDAHMVISGTYN